LGALREYAKTAPAAVAVYVAAHDHELSPLSKREALKYASTGNLRNVSRYGKRA